jgi:hypothetical protein
VQSSTTTTGAKLVTGTPEVAYSLASWGILVLWPYLPTGFTFLGGFCGKASYLNQDCGSSVIAPRQVFWRFHLLELVPSRRFEHLKSLHQLRDAACLVHAIGILYFHFIDGSWCVWLCS